MFLSTPTKIKTIRPSDEDWFIIDGLMMAARAGFEIDKSCPHEYTLIIAECINKGWLQPIAYQPIHEEFMEKLTK